MECSSSRSKTRRLSDQFWSTLRLERGLSTVRVWTSFRFEALTILVFARWKLPCWPFQILTRRDGSASDSSSKVTPWPVVASVGLPCLGLSVF